MRTLVFRALLCGVAGLVLAAKPPPLGGDNGGRGGAPSEPSPGGKPPPLGAPGGAAPSPGPAPGGDERPRPSRPRGQAPAEGEPEDPPSASGTGFVAAEGKLLTNNHVVDGCLRMMARNAQGVRLQAQVDATDTRRDLAVLSVPVTFGPPLTFREEPAIRRGESVITYGFPLSGLLSSGPILTTGDISGLTGLRDNPLNFQISAPVQPGNSGGPLLDSQGNVIGVVVSKLNAARIAQITGGDIPQNVNFAVKGLEALAFLREHNVTPHTANSTGPDKRPFEVGEIANPSTVFLQCYK